MAPVLGEAPPLLLLPLRLEYRVVNRAASIAALFNAPVATAAGQRIKTAEMLRREARTAQLRAPLETVVPKLAGDTEIWFRWYPDEGFAERGIAGVSADEGAALAQFAARIPTRVWSAASDADVAEAWQALAVAIGPARAVH